MWYDWRCRPLRGRDHAVPLCSQDLVDEVEIRRAVAVGRFWVREVRAVSALHRYRAMRERYGARPDEEA